MEPTKFWAKNPLILLDSFEVIPSDNRTKIENLNSITRMVLLIFIVLLLSEHKHSFLFLIISLFMIIIAYIQIKEKKEMKESYTPKKCNTYRRVNKVSTQNCNNIEGVQDKILTFDCENPSPNQRLVGKPNPKTLEPIVMIPRTTDLDHWRNNNYTTHSGINEQSQFDAYRSGYAKLETPTPANCNNRDPYCSGLRQTEPSPADKYNVDFLNVIQPDVYSYNTKIEPINSNIGISQTIQFPDVSFSQNGNNVVYDDSGMNEITVPCKMKPNCPDVDVSNVYDPRHTGYGSDDRCYYDALTGQTRYFYDDIDAVRMPNMSDRTNVRHSFIGSSNCDVDLNKVGFQQIRQSVHDKFIEGECTRRSELQERLMRKNNARSWQQKQFPMRTNMK